MKSKHSTHAAGGAAYARGSSLQNGATPAAEEADEIDAGAEPQDAAFQTSSGSELTAQEQQMIEEKFPEDSELSMRLYSRGRDAERVQNGVVGENIDVTG